MVILQRAVMMWQKVPVRPGLVRNGDFYRRFNRDCLKIAKPPINLTQQSREFKRGTREEVASEIIERALIVDPVL